MVTVHYATVSLAGATLALLIASLLTFFIRKITHTQKSIKADNEDAQIVQTDYEKMAKK